MYIYIYMFINPTLKNGSDTVWLTKGTSKNTMMQYVIVCRGGAFNINAY